MTISFYVSSTLDLILTPWLKFRLLMLHGSAGAFKVMQYRYFQITGTKCNHFHVCDFASVDSADYDVRVKILVWLLMLRFV